MRHLLNAGPLLKGLLHGGLVEVLIIKVDVGAAEGDVVAALSNVSL